LLGPTNVPKLPLEPMIANIYIGLPSGRATWRSRGSRREFGRDDPLDGLPPEVQHMIADIIELMA
jgi:hypothetical protein